MEDKLLDVGEDPIAVGNTFVSLIYLLSLNFPIIKRFFYLLFLQNICQVCGKGDFTSHDQLKRHMVKHNGNQEHHKCPHCAAVISRQDNLRRHITKVHTPNPSILATTPSIPSTSVIPSAIPSSLEAVRKVVQVGMGRATLLRSALNHALRTYQLVIPQPSLTMAKVFDFGWGTISEIMRQQKIPVRIQVSITVTLEQQTTRADVFFNSKAMFLNDISKQSLIDHFDQKLEKYTNTASNFIVISINKMAINVFRYHQVPFRVGHG